MRALFEAAGAAAPLVVVFDDIHWGETTFLDLVEDLADWSRDAPILLVCMARPELLEVRPGWGGGKLNATSVLLEPLSDDECAALIANLVGEAELATEVRPEIAEAAEGNPLFVEEMLLDARSTTASSSRGRPLGGGRRSRAVPVPPTIQALLAARLDQLDADERAVIERAAVVGKVFHEGCDRRPRCAEPRRPVSEVRSLARPQGADPPGRAASSRASVPIASATC